MKGLLRAGLRAACVLLAAGAFLASCDPFAGPLPAGMLVGPEVQYVPYAGSFTYTVRPSVGAREVYFVFTNPALETDLAQVPIVNVSSLSVDGQVLPFPSPPPLPAANAAPTSPAERIAEFNRAPSPSPRRPSPGGPLASLVSASPAQNDAANVTTGDFITDIDASDLPTATVPATCRAVVGPVDLGDGRSRTLSIWVEDAVWGVDMTDPRVAALAQLLLQDPASVNDIYHWATAVAGEPWGASTDPAFIGWDPRNTVTVLLSRLNADYSGSVRVGYFWAKDNYAVSALPGSNQRIMFYIDSFLFSKVESSRGEIVWSSTNFWPQMVFSTLAHEFQHMIQFYQKRILRGAANGTDTWINEMCSMVMEDLVADKLGVEGPRGVTTPDAGPTGNTQGRLGGPWGFTQYASTGLALPRQFGIIDYSVTYAFGAWLARNYGGADLLRRIVQSPLTNSTAITSAVETVSGATETMERLLSKWAAAVLLSDSTSAPPGYQYNTGGWMTSTSGGIGFKLGSIDMFRYSPALAILTQEGTVPATTFSRASNVYFKAASGLMAPRTWSLSIPAGIRMSVVLK